MNDYHVIACQGLAAGPCFCSACTRIGVSLGWKQKTTIPLISRDRWRLDHGVAARFAPRSHQG